jgi:hypothetical protein
MLKLSVGQVLIGVACGFNAMADNHVAFNPITEKNHSIDRTIKG